MRDFETRIAQLKEQLAALEADFAVWKKEEEETAAARKEEVEVDIDIDVIDLPAPVEEAPEIPVDDLPAPEILPEPEPLPAPEPEPVAEVFPESVPEPAPTAQEPRKAPRIPEGTYPWQTALPGMPVKNIRSAISLFDRALFINTLFKEDYALYDKTIGELNALTSMDEAVDYLVAHFPDWNLGSDVVYSFIMAIRKKLG